MLPAAHAATSRSRLRGKATCGWQAMHRIVKSCGGNAWNTDGWYGMAVSSWLFPMALAATLWSSGQGSGRCVNDHCAINRTSEAAGSFRSPY